MRAHNLLRSLNSAVTVTALPTATTYRSEGRGDRLAELLVRGTRYTLALLVPPAVVGIVLSGPILAAWLGERFREADVAMAILMAHWLVNGCSGLMTAVLVGVGRARAVAGYSIALAAGNLAIAAALIPPLGLEGAALATTAPYLLLFPVLARMSLESAAVPAGRLLREAFVPALAAGAMLASALVAIRLLFDPEGAAPVAAVAGGGALACWACFYAFFMSADERQLVRDVVLPRRR